MHPHIMAVLKYLGHADTSGRGPKRVPPGTNTRIGQAIWGPTSEETLMKLQSEWSDLAADPGSKDQIDHTVSVGNDAADAQASCHSKTVCCQAHQSNTPRLAIAFN